MVQPELHQPGAGERAQRVERHECEADQEPVSIALQEAQEPEVRRRAAFPRGVDVRLGGRRRQRVDLLELVWANLLRIYEPEAAREWLLGLNPHLGDRRPIDLIRAGRTEELMRAIRSDRADSFA